MRFSVLMSVYRGENPGHFRESLTSVFSQTLPPTEVVLVKDGPLTDELDRVIEEFHSRNANLEVVSLPANRGLGFALNTGLYHCSHEIVARMDTDDIAVPTRFERQIAEFVANPAISLVGSSVAEFESDPNRIERVRSVALRHEDIKKRFGQRCPVNHPTVVFRRRDVLSAGGYNDKFVQEDYYLWGRMLAKGQVFKNLAEPVVLMRCGAGLFGRRGGWRYAVSEAKLQAEFYRLGLVTLAQLFVNTMTRFVVRVMPEGVRRLIYTRLLRESVIE